MTTDSWHRCLSIIWLYLHIAISFALRGHINGVLSPLRIVCEHCFGLDGFRLIHLPDLSRKLLFISLTSRCLLSYAFSSCCSLRLS